MPNILGIPSKTLVYLPPVIPTPSYTYPPVIPTPRYLPLDTYPLGIPTPRYLPPRVYLLPGRGLGPEIPIIHRKDLGLEIHLPACGQTNTCEYITFLQLRWQEIISEFCPIFFTLHFCLSHAAVTFSSVTKL